MERPRSCPHLLFPAAVLAATLGCTGSAEPPLDETAQAIGTPSWCPRGFAGKSMSNLVAEFRAAVAQGRIPHRTAELLDHILLDDLAEYTAATAIPYVPVELSLWTRNRVLPARGDFGIIHLPEGLRRTATFTAHVGVNTDSSLSHVDAISELSFRSTLSVLDPIKTDGGITISELLFAAAHLDSLRPEQRAAFEMLIEYVSDPEQYGQVAVRRTRVVFVPGPDAWTPTMITVFDSVRMDAYLLDPACSSLSGTVGDLDAAALGSILPVLTQVPREVALGATVLLREELSPGGGDCMRMDSVDIPTVEDLQRAVTDQQASLDVFRDIRDHIEDHDPMKSPAWWAARQHELQAHYIEPLEQQIADLRLLVTLREPRNQTEHDTTVAKLATRVRTDVSGVSNGVGACLGHGTANFSLTTYQLDAAGTCNPSQNASVRCVIETAGAGAVTCMVSVKVLGYAGSPSETCYDHYLSKTVSKPGQIHVRDRVVLERSDAFDQQTRVQLRVLDRYTLSLEKVYVRTGDHAMSFDGAVRTPIRWVGDGDVDALAWQSVSRVGAPTSRTQHAAVWTGDEMIIWGGRYWTSPSRTRDDGMRYSPTTNTWRPMSRQHAPTGALAHAVWTGSELLVVGRTAGSSGRYDPATDQWSSMSFVGAPSVSDSVAVWTGSELIVWGVGFGGVVAGGRYDPLLDQWTPISNVDSPGVRYSTVAVWTGTQMIVWGGTLSGPTWAPLASGASYDPATDTWTPLPDAPRAGRGNVVWTGDEMIVWPLGLRYVPRVGAWREVTKTGRPGSEHANVVWTGTEMLVWGGANLAAYPYSLGGRYDPQTDSWAALLLPSEGPPNTRQDASPLAGQSLVWTGSEMITWGGGYQRGTSTYTSQFGARFTP